MKTHPMTRSTILSTTFALLSIVSLALPAQAGFVIEHLGTSDPTTEGFAVISAGSTSAVAPIANDLGKTVWSIAGTNSDSQFGYYSGPFTAAQQADIASQGFVLTLEARVLQGVALPYDTTNYIGIANALVDTGSRRFEVYLGVDSNGNTVATLPSSISIGPGGSISAPGPSVTLAGTGYHLYQLVYNPVSQLADLFIDGVGQISNYPGHTSFVSNLGLIWSADSGGQGNFSRVEVATVPEPSTLALGAIGLVMLAIPAMRRCWGRRV